MCVQRFHDFGHLDTYTVDTRERERERERMASAKEIHLPVCMNLKITSNNTKPSSILVFDRYVIILGMRVMRDGRYDQRFQKVHTHIIQERVEILQNGKCKGDSSSYVYECKNFIIQHKTILNSRIRSICHFGNERRTIDYDRRVENVRIF